MRKLLIAAAVIAVGSLGMAASASAQAYYPGSNGAPARQGGYSYPGTYGTYPGTYGTYPSYPQQSTTAREHRRGDDDRYDRRARRDDDRSQYQARDQYDRRGNYNSNYNYNYGVGVNGAPSRVGNHEAGTNGRYRSRNGRWGRDGR